jgi:hypothetical protein
MRRALALVALKLAITKKLNGQEGHDAIVVI